MWLGDVQDMHGFLMSLDAFMMISHPAGCPNASMEAMAVGVPVIATDVGGASELNRTSRSTGWLITTERPLVLNHPTHLNIADVMSEMIHELPDEKHVIIDLFSEIFQDLIDAMGNQSSVAPENHVIEAI